MKINPDYNRGLFLYEYIFRLFGIKYIILFKFYITGGKTMNEKKDKFHEVIERYCNVIKSNTPILRINTEDRVTYECLNKGVCENTRGECKNEKYG